MFQSHPWPQVYKSKHLGMQTVSTNMCERLGRSQELSGSQSGTVIGCHLSSCEISLLLNIPQSTVSGIITKWKRLGTTATQPGRGRPRKMTEQGQWMLQTSRLHVAFSSRLAQEQCVQSFMEWVSMAEQSSCIQSTHQQVQCKALDAVV